MPDMTSVFSTSVDKIGHDPDTGELHVQWPNGKTSVYTGVPPDVAASVSKSWSVGQALNEQVKGRFDHRYL